MSTILYNVQSLCSLLRTSPITAAFRRLLVGKNDSAFGFNWISWYFFVLVVSSNDSSVGMSNCNGLLKCLVPLLPSETMTLISAALIFPSFPGSNFVIFANFLVESSWRSHLAVPSFLRMTRSPTATCGSSFPLIILVFSFRLVRYSCFHRFVKCCKSLL